MSVQKDLKTIRDELAESFAKENAYFDKKEFPYGLGFTIGFDAATDIVFDKIVEVLKNNEDDRDMRYIGAWLAANKDRIIK